jgi:hypothetical protein
VPLLTAAKATPVRWLELCVLATGFLATLPFFLSGQLWTLVAMPLHVGGGANLETVLQSLSGLSGFLFLFLFLFCFFFGC